MKTPESVLKKRATQAKIAAVKEAAKVEAEAKAVADTVKYAERAAKYDKEYQAEEKAAIDARRQAKAKGGFYVPAEPKLCLVSSHPRLHWCVSQGQKGDAIVSSSTVAQCHLCSSE